jgi:protein-disulfide isomerase
MNRRTLVFVIGGIAFAAFALGAFLYQPHEQGAATPVSELQLERPHSPIIGPREAPVTIVEFFDPSCETCRKFYPHVKEILAAHPGDVRLVLRYAPFHEGSDEAVRILEAARLQDKFVPVLDALIAAQPEWAVHGAPNLAHAWEVAQKAGLDLERARADASRPEIDALLKQDLADIKAINLNRTPTFFINGKPLLSFGVEQLADQVRSEVALSKSAAN